MQGQIQGQKLEEKQRKLIMLKRKLDDMTREVETDLLLNTLFGDMFESPQEEQDAFREQVAAVIFGTQNGSTVSPIIIKKEKDQDERPKKVRKVDCKIVDHQQGQQAQQASLATPISTVNYCPLEALKDIDFKKNQSQQFQDKNNNNVEQIKPEQPTEKEALVRDQRYSITNSYGSGKKETLVPPRLKYTDICKLRSSSGSDSSSMGVSENIKSTVEQRKTARPIDIFNNTPIKLLELFSKTPENKYNDYLYKKLMHFAQIANQNTISEIREFTYRIFGNKTFSIHNLRNTLKFKDPVTSNMLNFEDAVEQIVSDFVSEVEFCGKFKVRYSSKEEGIIVVKFL